MTVYTTLNKISAFEPSKSLWKELLSSLGKTAPDDEPLSLVYILESNGVIDALWCTRTVFDEHRKKIVQYAIRCAENVLPIFEKSAPNDTAPRLAIQAAKDYLNGKITKADLWAAADAAWAAATAAAWAAAWTATRSAAAARAAARATAADAAWAAAAWAAAAAEAATDAVWAVWAAAAEADAAAAATWAAAAAWHAEKQFQKNLFREIFGEVQP